jgi:hypothetical protein
VPTLEDHSRCVKNDISSQCSTCREALPAFACHGTLEQYAPSKEGGAGSSAGGSTLACNAGAASSTSQNGSESGSRNAVYVLRSDAGSSWVEPRVGASTSIIAVESAGTRCEESECRYINRGG